MKTDHAVGMLLWCTTNTQGYFAFLEFESSNVLIQRAESSRLHSMLCLEDLVAYSINAIKVVKVENVGPPMLNTISTYKHGSCQVRHTTRPLPQA